MNKIKCFKYEESQYHPGKYIISPIYENLPLIKTDGSYSILPARLMNLTYAQYLRMCRDLLGAEIIGKNSLYPIALFKRDDTFIQFIKLLNARANLILFEREHPDNDKKREELEKNGKY